MSKRKIFSSLYRNLPRIVAWITLSLGLTTLSLGILTLLNRLGILTNIPLIDSTMLNIPYIPIESALICLGVIFLISSVTLFVIQYRSDARRKLTNATLVIRGADLDGANQAKKPYAKPQFSPDSTISEYSIASPRTEDHSCALGAATTDQETPFMKTS